MSTSPLVGLSTVCAWAPAHPAPAASSEGAGLLPPTALIARLERAGAAFVALDAALPEGYLDELSPLLAARRDHLPVRVVESPCPASRAAAASLSSLDRAEARAAVAAAAATVIRAADLGARFVLLGLGEIPGLEARWTTLRRAFRRGALDGDTAPLERLRRDRLARAARHLDATRRGLDEIAGAADRCGMRLGLRNPARPMGLPLPLELRLLLDDLRGAPIVPALDAPAAHLQAALGFTPLDETLAAFGASPACLLADACGPVFGLPPGRGELDFAPILRALPDDTHATFTPAPALVESEILDGMNTLRKLFAAATRPTTTKP